MSPEFDPPHWEHFHKPDDGLRITADGKTWELFNYFYFLKNKNKKNRKALSHSESEQVG